MIECVVLAVDPGPTESAWVLWDGKRLRGHAMHDNGYLLSFPPECGTPDQIAIEMITSYGMPVGRDVFDTCVWIGRFYQAWGGAALIPRHDVKMHLCGSPRAKDSNIRQALIDRLGKPGTKKQPGATYGIAGDKWQALAVAVTWWDQQDKA